MRKTRLKDNGVKIYCPKKHQKKFQKFYKGMETIKVEKSHSKLTK